MSSMNGSGRGSAGVGAPEARRLVEWPTLSLIVLCHLVWAGATGWISGWSLPLAMVLTIPAITLHSSLQHEVLHGHPTRLTWLNALFVSLPVGLCIPYGRFRDTHLAHHRDEFLTDPYDDPESNYLDPAVWQRLAWPLRAILRINNTLAGRMILGPAISIWTFTVGDLKAIAAGNRAILRDWLVHLVGVGLVVLWISAVAMPGWAYLACAYVGLSILKIRTFLEHRAHELARGRTVLIDGGRILPFLFLNNNLHVVHHAKPTVAWYRLPALYRANRADYLRRNDGYAFASYGEVFRRYFLRAKDPVPHPLWKNGQ